jgi:NADP-dependent 3-hydroxy acid dehydrogenase YdfG
MTSPNSIFISGAASGIGRETALFFARKGWIVGIFDIDEDGLSLLQSEIGGDNCYLQKMDVTNFEDVKSAVAAFVEKTGGKINVLFNNAGILRMGAFESISIKEQMMTVDVNFKGILNCVNAALEILKQTKDARIINMSSASAAYGIPELAVYSATKHAVRGLTEALNIEFEAYDIHVCDIMPGYVATPMVADATVQARSVEKLGVNIKADEIAQLVWKAAHKKKIHWPLGGSFLISMILTIFPFLKRSLIKSSAGY